jgi:hypothetical protein
MSGNYAHYPLALDMYLTSTLLISDNVSQSTLAGHKSWKDLICLCPLREHAVLLGKDES